MRPLLRRAVDWLRDPPDLIEKPPAVQFVIAIFPDYTARITATKLAQPQPEQVTAVTQAAVDMLFRWAQANGVQITVKGPTQTPAPKPTGNPLRGVRP